MSTQMSVFISHQPAAAQWGEKAILSFSDNGAIIHIGVGHDLGAIQQAGRKLDNQGVRAANLQGEGWDLEAVWAFYQATVIQRNTTQ